MAIFTPTYIFLGNSSDYGFGLVNPDWDSANEAESDTSVTETDLLMGRTFDSEDMQGVTVTANSTHDIIVYRGETPFSYTLHDYDGNGEPTGSGTTYEEVYTSHAVVNLTVNLQREDNGSIETDSVDLRGVVIQMENGDLFVRPYYLDVTEWETTLGDWGISSITTNYLVTGLDPSSSNTDAFTNGMDGSAGFAPRFAGPVDEPVVCFTPGTLIETPEGQRPVEELRAGDFVTTRDNGAQQIRWISQRRFQLADIAGRDKIRPIRIAAGALGDATPSQDLVVSPQHRILVRSAIAQRMFGTAEILVAAKQLLGLKGVSVDETAEDVTYVHFLLSRHEVVIANGAEAESLYTGSEALKAVGAAAREEIFSLFPELKDEAHQPASARTLVPGRKARSLVQRHIKNNRSLVMSQ